MKKYILGIAAAGFVFLSACSQPGDTGLPDDATQEEITSEEGAFIGGDFTTPDEISASEKARILAGYEHLDPNKVVPSNLLKKAVVYFDANKAKVANQRYLSVIDFSKHSKYARFFIINMSTGAVWAIHVAHGSGSDSNHDGIAEKFSNTSGSNASSLGFYQTAETYSGKHGLSLTLDGLSSTNSRVRARAIVIHGADYVAEATVKQGRSWGCPAVSMSIRTEVINRLKGGSIIYAGRSAVE